ncbi:MAG TPA: ABC transporter ATP-binding protein [Thermomicrobiales bacterium]|nr:ABC transporter ATP-binding protein [Thermomicrobiales bacterium]
MSDIVIVEDLVKHYGAVHAVDGISFAVAEGEIFGLLGHNGAGKTTTIRMLTGRTRPSAGRASIAGFDVVEDLDQIKPIINLVFEDANLYERLTGRDNLAMFARLYGVPVSRADELLEMLDLTEAAKRRVKTYSTGMKQRLVIARALINSPKVLFLDEPTRGLDPASARELRELIVKLAAGGTTVVLTTHYMNEADELCDRVAFLKEGKIVALDSPQELKLKYGRRAAKVLLDNREEREIDLTSPADAQTLSNWMSQGRVMTLHSEEGTLEDVFINIAGPAHIR